MTSKIFDIKQAAHYLGISETTMRRLVVEHKITAKRITTKDEKKQGVPPGRKGKNGVWRIRKEWIDHYLIQGTDLEDLIKEIEQNTTDEEED